ncbi:hypothetical protein NDU88_008868 [Pleurodeles waltl]|uniref:Uncharacterized protein n=1 Tax=Pleurodeles waltl TaxID=8319 RepID=A0AAV7PTC2_PLEWA|nr:hypothetical protein NDU88_008868 [Pleurodeles waltl]
MSRKRSGHCGFGNCSAGAWTHSGNEAVDSLMPRGRLNLVGGEGSLPTRYWKLLTIWRRRERPGELEVRRGSCTNGGQGEVEGRFRFGPHPLKD